MPTKFVELILKFNPNLAKAAELNSVSGPKRHLQMKNEFGLDETQFSAIDEVYQQLKKPSRIAGRKANCFGTASW